MLITSNDIRTKHFNSNEGLVDSREVIEFLDTVARQVDDLLTENAFLKESIFRVDKHNQELKTALEAVDNLKGYVLTNNALEEAVWKFLGEVMMIKSRKQ